MEISDAHKVAQLGRGGARQRGQQHTHFTPLALCQPWAAHRIAESGVGQRVCLKSLHSRLYLWHLLAVNILFGDPVHLSSCFITQARLTPLALSSPSPWPVGGRDVTSL